MIESFKLKTPAFLSQPEAPYVVRLMMALDSLRSALRWFEYTKKGERTPELRFDQLMSLITCCGWGWAAVELVREGKKDGWLEPHMIADAPVLISCWEEVTAKRESKRLKRMLLVRHLPKIFIERHKNKPAEELPAILETSDQGKFLRTTYPWAYLAFATHLYPEPFDIEEARRRIHKTIELINSVLHLLQGILGAFTDEMALECEQTNQSCFGLD